jgi:hypothetical protein
MQFWGMEMAAGPLALQAALPVIPLLSPESALFAYCYFFRECAFYGHFFDDPLYFYCYLQ